MTREKNSVGADRAFNMLMGESEVSRWANLIVRNWGFLYVGLVLLVIWLPSRATPAGSRVFLWIASYTVYLVALEILGRLAKRTYDSTLFRSFRIHFNLAMIAVLALVAPPTASSYIWFFFAMPLLVTLGYLGRPLPLLVVYVEVCVAMLIMTLAQGWPTPLDWAAMVAKDAILGLLTTVLYYFVLRFPRIREESALLRVATTLMQVLDREELAQLLADAAKVGVPTSDAAVVHLLGGEGNQILVPAGSSHLDLSALGQSLMRIGVGIAGHAVQRHETINVPDVDKDERYHQLPPSFIPFKSLLVAPMYVGNKNVGTISVHSARKGAFRERDGRFLTVLAAQGAIAIANAELYNTRAQRRRQISDILSASRAFGLNQPLSTLLETIAVETCRCSGYRMAVVNLFDKASNEIVVRAIAGVPPEGMRKLEGIHIPLNVVTPLFQDEFRTSQSYFIRHDRCPEIPSLDQYTFTPDLGERRPGEWHQADMLIVPIQTQEEDLLGYISVDDPVDRQLPSLDTIQALEILGSVAATAIQNARLYAQAQQEITERKRAEESLVREQQLLKTFMDNVPDHIYFKDTESRFTRINKALARWFGLDDPEQAIGKTDFDFFADEHARQAYADEQEVMRTGQPISKEEKETWPDGRETWVSTTKVLLRDERGDIVGTFGVSRDITERKRALDALQQRTRELELLNRVGQALSSSLDLEQVIVAALEEIRRLLGVAAASVWLKEQGGDGLICQQVTGPHSEIVRGWRLAQGQGIAGWVASHGESQVVVDTRVDERHYKELDRRLGWEIRSILSVPLKVKQDVIGVLEVVDTEANRFQPTDLKLVEPLAASTAIAITNARLYEETDRLRAFNENIVQSMEEGILLEDLSGRIIFTNRKTAELLGYTPEELIGRHGMTLVAPEELTKVQQEPVKRPQGVASRYETILLTKDGQRVPVIVSAKPLLDQGSFAGMLAVYTDITDRKRQETRLQEYLSTVTSNLALRTSREGLYEFIIVAGTKLLPARDCFLFLVSEGNSNILELAATTASHSADRPRIVISTAPRCGIVAYVAATCQPIRLVGAEIIGYPAWNEELWRGLGWDFDAQARHSLLAVPMCLPGGRLVGALVVRDAEGQDGFSEFDEVLLKTLATNAAADIERVRGSERAREDAIRTERTRLEADLHEAMNVLATGVRWEAEILSDEIERSYLTASTAAHVALTRLQAALTRAYTDLRYLLEDLRDPSLEHDGLLAALEKRAQLIGHERIVVHHGDFGERLPPEVEAVLYRVGQEAMSNAIKHSGVVHNPDVKIEVWLERSDEQVKLCVKDDGLGFDVEPILALSDRWGLRRLRDKLHEIGGKLGIDSVPGKGTTICATIGPTGGSHG